jgi:malate dehydrogenase (oxaloacetate-decarboxylating)
MLPLVYTPTVGQGCEEFSNYWHYPRGLFLSWPQRARIANILAHPRFDNIEAIVVSDGERIFRSCDQGAGGMGMPIGKLSLYTACAGLHPATTLPILLDTGTDNRERLADPIYIGWRHERVRGADYDNFMEQFVTAVERRWPHVLLQWGDFARPTAGRILQRYRDRLCGSTTTSKVLQRSRPVHCSQPRTSPGRRRFFAVDRDEGMEDLQPFQAPFVQPRAAVDGWTRSRSDRIDLFDVVKNARPTVLIGVSGQPGMFTEEVVRTMAGTVARPVIFPLSNRVSRSEAIPADLLRWTDGRALVGTGSPFPPVEIDGKPLTVDQTNNAYIFPGSVSGFSLSRPVGLATTCSQRRQRRWPVSRPLFATVTQTCCHRWAICARWGNRRRRRPPGPRGGTVRGLRRLGGWTA